MSTNEETGELSDLLSERVQGPDGDALSEAGGVAVQQEKKSPYAMQMDRWGARRGKTIYDSWKRSGILSSDDKINADYGWSEEVIADAHNCLFEPTPKISKNPADAKKAAWFQQLLDSPEYAQLHQQTMLDGDLTELASKTVCDQWVAYAAEAEEPKEDEDIKDTLDRMRSVDKALKNAGDDVEDAKNLQAGLGMGEGGVFDRKRMAQHFKTLKGSRKLRNMFAIAGRLRKLAAGIQRNKVNCTRGEITGIEQSGDIARLLSNELAMVAGCVPELEMLSLLKLAQRRSLSYKHQRKVPKSMGPIVVCVDESGSMEGELIEFAKALSMTMAWLANAQRRWCALVGFEAGGHCSQIVIQPGKLKQDKLIEWLMHFYDGGTTLDVPLNTVPFRLWPKYEKQGLPKGKTDMIVITDGCVSADAEQLEKYKAWAAAEHVKTYGIIIGAGSPGGVGQMSDKYWCVPDLNLDSAPVAAVLGI